MENLSGYAHRPIQFVLRYIRKRMAAHLVISSAVVFAVACSVGTQYGVKNLVDSLSAGPPRANGVWLAFVVLMTLIAADNLLWRVASWIPLSRKVTLPVGVGVPVTVAVKVTDWPTFAWSRLDMRWYASTTSSPAPSAISST